MQNSKEVVKAAVEFSGPDRLPVIFSCFDNTDVLKVKWNQTGAGDITQKRSFDEWGCGWERTDAFNMGQVTYHPLEDWSNLDKFIWVDPDAPAFYEGMEQRLPKTEEYYVNTSIFMLLFERMHSLRGFENTLTDLYLEREKIEYLADRIVEYDIRIINNLKKRFPTQIDGLTFTDDWGTELALFINPLKWREFFKPRYKRIFDAIHGAGWHVWMHSCGKVNDILGDLYEIGVNVVNLQQPRLLGIEETGKKYAGKLCFQSLCDIQHTLPFEDEEYIRSEAKLLLEHWGTDKGGFILSDYGHDEAIGVSGNKKRVMYDAFMEYDRWRSL